MKLSEDLQIYRSDRPDEWTMDHFVREAKKLEVNNEAQIRRAIDLAIESTQDAAYAANYHGDELIEVEFNEIDKDAIVQKVLEGTNE